MMGRLPFRGRRSGTKRAFPWLGSAVVGAGALALFVTVPIAQVAGAQTGAPAVTNYTDPSMSQPFGITSGPDGALWFTNLGNDSIGRITTAGTVTNYTGNGISEPSGITTGPDGALWFTNLGNRSIGRITTDGTVTDYSDPTISDPYDITAGSDGALWFTNLGNDSIGRITTDGTITNYTDPSISAPWHITSAPDGALWFTNYHNRSIGRITTGGVVTNYTGNGISEPSGITTGPDGALWFTNYGNRSIGRITMAGAVTDYAAAGMDDQDGITTGPDGALWFTNYGKHSIGRITTAGVVTKYSAADIDYPDGITAGADGALWFTNRGGSIGRITTPQVTVALTKTSNLMGHDAVNVSGSGWNAHSDSSVQIYQCASTVFASNTCDSSNAVGATIETAPNGKIGKFADTSIDVATGVIDANGDTCGLGGSSLCYIVVVGSTDDQTSSSALGFKLPTVTVSPDSVKNASGRTITVHAKGFPKGDVITAEECDSSFTLGDTAACDPSTLIQGTANAGGTVKGWPKITVLSTSTSPSYSDSNSPTAWSAPGATSWINVVDTTNPTVGPLDASFTIGP